MKPWSQIATALLAVASALVGLSTARPGQSPDAGVTSVTAEDLLAVPVGSNWTSYNGDYTGRRYSSLHEINDSNVARLRASWVFHPGNSQRLEATPVVVNGVMFVTSANDMFALDARTGRALWHYQRPVSSGLLDDAAAHKNRGVAVWQNFVYMETDDAHLLCLDARSGALRWDVTYADKAKVGHGDSWGGTLTTTGGLVFFGDDAGSLEAVEAGTGRALWHFNAGQTMHASPMSYAIDGAQFVAVSAGSDVFAFSLPH